MDLKIEEMQFKFADNLVKEITIEISVRSQDDQRVKGLGRYKVVVNLEKSETYVIVGYREEIDSRVLQKLAEFTKNIVSRIKEIIEASLLKYALE